MKQWFLRLFCHHASLTLETTGPALVSPRGAPFAVTLPGVQATCLRCGEFWHSELDASEALKAWLATQ